MATDGLHRPGQTSFAPPASLANLLAQATPASAPNGRRTTCDICRDRKVRCDRGKPECARCKRAGHRCTYSSSSNDSRSIDSALQHLHTRLLQTEARLREQTQQRAPEQPSNGSCLATESPLKDANPIDDPIFGDDFLTSTLGSWDMDLNYQSSTFSGDTATENFTLRDCSADNYVPASSSIHNSSGHVSSAGEDQINNTRCVSEPSDVIEIGDGQHTSPLLSHLHMAYFDNAHKHFPLFPREALQDSTGDSMSHQVTALKYAVAMAGASCSSDLAVLEGPCYTSARNSLEKAEIEEDGSSILTLEAAQALILVARRELSKASPARALVTMGRLIRVITLLVSQYSSSSECDVVPSSRSSATHESATVPNPASALERAFWVTLVLNCLVISKTGQTSIAEMDETPFKRKLSPTRTPVGSWHRNPPHQFASLPDSTNVDIQPLLLFVAANKLVVSAQHHHSATAREISDGYYTEEFNFCYNHERLDYTISTTRSAVARLAGADEKCKTLLAVTNIILLGVRITLYRAAMLAVQRAEFLAPIAGESRRICLEMATEMARTIRQANMLAQEQTTIYKETSLFIDRPLMHAAETFLRDAPPSSFDGETKQSFETIYRALETLGIASPEREVLLQECKSTLEAKRSPVYSMNYSGPQRPALPRHSSRSSHGSLIWS